ncbi:MAG: DUF3245 domain-containing protein [Hymenobacter sp.]|nr:MAG: DUF3245 domain-containing protein [Hymenobacter sp.]
MTKNNEDTDRLQAQIGVSISLARNLVASWLPPANESEKSSESKLNGKKASALVNRRVPRAGLGATGEKDESTQLSVEDLKIKRALMHKEKKIKEQAKDREESMRKKEKKRKGHSNDDAESSEEEGEQKGRKKSKSSNPNVNGYDAFMSKKSNGKDQRRGFGR